MDQMTESMTKKPIKTMAALFLLTCPGDWHKGFGPMTVALLKRYITATIVRANRSEKAEMSVTQGSVEGICAS